MPLPPGWRRLTEKEKAEVRRLYLAAIHGATTSSAALEFYRALRGKTRREVLEILGALGREYATVAAAGLQVASTRAQSKARRAAASGLVQRATGGAGGLSGSLADRAAAWLKRQVEGARQSYQVSPIKGRKSSVLFPEGGVWLSRNLHGGNTPQVITRLRAALIEGARHGETATALAQRLRDDIGHIVNTGHGSTIISAKVRQIEAEAYRAIRASGDPRASQRFAPIREQFRAYAEGLRQTTKSSSAAAYELLEKITRAVERSDAVAVESAVKWHAWNREQDHQQLIARTETARAYSHAYTEAGKSVPWIVGYEWNTDDNPCDECAALGGQVFPKDALPELPAHPNCECYWTEVFDTSVEPSDAEWDRILGD